MAGKQNASSIWALRMPGGPTKVIKSDSPISETTAKDVYRDSFRYRSTEVDSDPDVAWPLVRAIDEQVMRSEYGSFVEVSSRTGMPRSLVEV